jgi:hypothetical protein
LGLFFLAFFFGCAPGVATVAPSSLLDESAEGAVDLSDEAAGAAESEGAAGVAAGSFAGSAEVAGAADVAGAVDAAGGFVGADAG